MTGQKRHQPRCQVAGCRALVVRAVEIELPMAWEASAEHTVLTVVVGACAGHGHALACRVRGLLEARAEYPQLLSIIERAAVEDAARRRRMEEVERDLVEAEGALDYQRERAEHAESAMRVVAATPEAIRYEAGEDGPQRVAAWLVAPADMDALRAALPAASRDGGAASA
jgi:hypothetical protein